MTDAASAGDCLKSKETVLSDSHSVPTQVNKAAAEVSLQIEKIYANKNFSKLVSGRNRLVCSLLSIIFIGYFGFLGVVCLMPGFAAAVLPAAG